MQRLRTISFCSSLLLLLALLGGCEVVPYQPQPLPQQPAPAPYPPVVYPTQPPAPNYAYEEMRRCRADNQRAHAEVLDNYERARQAGRIDPAEAQRFYAMDAQLRNMRGELGRDGITLRECQYLGGEIARMRNEVIRMSRFDPALARCSAENRQVHQETLNIYESARQNGRINPYEAQRFNSMEERLRLLSADVARTGNNLPDCQRISSALAQERDEVIRMSRHDSPIARCMADNRLAHDAVYTTYNDGVRAGRIDPRESQRFAEMDQRLRGMQAEIRRESVNMDDCLRVGAAISREHAVVDRMIRR